MLVALSISSTDMKLIAYIFFWTISIQLTSQSFIEVAEESGISHITFDPNQMSGGISVIDFNLDGYEDLYFTGGKYMDHLYRNNGNGTFEDVTSEMGVDVLQDYYTVGVIAGDLDNDGYTDLFITTQQGQPNICLRNMKGLSFEMIDAGFFGTKWSTSCTLGDVDMDGDLDMYVSNFVSFSGDPFFINILNDEPNHFIENKGPWDFGKGDLQFSGSSDGCTLVSCFTDIDNDLDPDLYVINDFGYTYGPNEVFINNWPEEQLIDRSETFGLNDGMDGMGIAIGDIDENGFNDYYLSDVGVCPFYLHDGGNQFRDGNLEYNINDGIGFSWGTFFADMDNDSYLDLFVAKGSISESSDPQYNKLYRYNPSLSDYDDASESSGINDPHRGRGAVYADFNNDGLLDIIVNNVRIKENNEGRALVYINQSEDVGNYIKVLLEGVESNRNAIGSHILLYAGDRMLRREITGGSSYLSNNSYVVHFGVKSMEIDSMVVLWPSGLRQKFDHITPNNFFYLKENNNLEIYELNNSTPTYDHNVSIQFKLSPNPVNDHFYISGPENSGLPVQINIIDVTGTIKLHINDLSLDQAHQYPISVTNWNKGLYLVCLSYEGIEHCKKLIVTD